MEDQTNQISDKHAAIRRVHGFEVRPGFEMPAPPRPGLVPCFQFHGPDGMSLFWWDDGWGPYPACYKSWQMCEMNGIDHYEIGDCEPLVNPDTGGSRYKDCAAALRELGFREV